MNKKLFLFLCLFSISTVAVSKELGDIVCDFAATFGSGKVIIGIGTLAIMAVAVGYFWGAQLTEAMKGILTTVIIILLAFGAGGIVAWAATAAGKTSCTTGADATRAINISRSHVAPPVDVIKGIRSAT